jgi:monofunctional biosynthetic peptidoglycan transglycosylase
LFQWAGSGALRIRLAPLAIIGEALKFKEPGMAAAPRRPKTPLRLHRLARPLIWLAGTFLLVTILQVAVLRFVNPPVTVSVIWDFTRQRIKAKPYRPPAFVWQPIEKISPHLRRAALAAEDQRFAEHHGFDLVEIRKAAKDILREQRIRGASTISMQTARTVYLLPVRSIPRKALEAYYTALIELFWGKRRILEMYLNTVDWGAGVMGAEAASQRYFKISSARLNPRQAALLVAVLPNPHRLSPLRPDSYVQGRVRRILADMQLMPLL